MPFSKISRTVLVTALSASLATTALIGSANAGDYSRRNDAGAAIALGIGALIVGGILASKSKHRRHEDERHYQPAPRHHFAPRHGHHDAPTRQYGPVRERFND